MNSITATREMLGLDRKEFGLLLGWSEGKVAEVESFPDFQLADPYRTISTIFILLSQSCAHKLVEHRINTLPAGSDDRETLSRVARKILGGHRA